MLKRFFSSSFLLLFVKIVLGQLPPIGYWREHLSYHQALHVVSAGSAVYCSTPYSLFSVDIADNSIERFNKINGLHEVGVQTIYWDDDTQKLIVAYTNSNIDILSGGKILNIDAIKQKETVGDKTVYSIFGRGGNAYLSTGIGIIVIDETKYEVKDTYVIGNTGNNVQVNAVTSDGTNFYAATTEGLKRGSVNAVNLADYKNWQLVSGSGGLNAGACANAVNVQNSIIVQKDDSLFVLNGSAWTLLYTDGWSMANITSSENKLVVSERKGSSSRVLVINNTGLVEKTITDAAVQWPEQSIVLQNSVWVADSISGLLSFSGTGAQRFLPNSPAGIATGELAARDGTIWAAAGAVSPTWTNTFNKNGIYQLSNDEWINYTNADSPAFDSLYDIIALAPDPLDNSIWGGSFGGGLFHLKQDKNIEVFKKNSTLPPSISDLSKYFIAGLSYDNAGNLWIANYNAIQNLSVKKPGGTFQNFTVPFFLASNAVSQIQTDDYNQVWMISPRGSGLICFNWGQSVENTGDDHWQLYSTGKGNGNLPDNNVLCIARDKKSFIWVGTVKGVGIIQCPQLVFAQQGCDAILPVVQQDNFAGYLFSDEQVQTIAVDGADRKWVGTKNGVWLISPDGDKTIYRFTQDNSPLLDNDVKKIGIDGKTGEVFFATAKGICSFRSTATSGTETNSNVLVFPNPVPPGYNGTIAIRGLVENAIVKITSLDGRLVYQTRALGGQAVWDGKNYKGGKVSTGVYLVLVSDDSRTEKIATKIVFISK